VFIVHRLDRMASGLLVFARTAEAKRALQAQLEERSVERLYFALVEGRVEQAEGELRSWLVEEDSGRVRVLRDGDARGREAVTRWRVIGRGAARTALEVKLLTGRKHQIRIQLASIGHPVTGDPLYGRGGGKASGPDARLGLHARLLGFSHPVTGEALRFRSEPPAALASQARGRP
jgi:RluA family pseudouridine synthase